MANDDYVDNDETSVEEEVIVVIDDEYTDHTRDEVLAEFVTYKDLPPERPAPTPPRPKGAFEMYNEQLKETSANKTGWMGKMKKRMSSKSSKPNEATISEEFAVEPEKPKSSTSFASSNGSSGHIKKGAAGWWGMGKKDETDSRSESSDVEDSTAFEVTEDVMEPATNAVDPPGTRMCR